MEPRISVITLGVIDLPRHSHHITLNLASGDQLARHGRAIGGSAGCLGSQPGRSAVAAGVAIPSWSVRPVRSATATPQQAIPFRRESDRSHADRVTLKAERVQHWLGVGALPTDRVARFLGDAGLIEKPAMHETPVKSRPKARAQERLKAAEEAAGAAAGRS